MIDKNQLIQIAGWVRPGLRLEDLPNNSWNVNDPDTRAKIHCAVTGCENRGNALAIIQVETEEAMTTVPAMWQLEVVAATRDRRETRRQIPLCFEHAEVVAKPLAKGMTLPRGTSLTPIRQIAMATKTNRYARFQSMLGEAEFLPTPPPAKLGIQVRDLVAALVDLLELLQITEELPEDEHLYGEAYARYDELI